MQYITHRRRSGIPGQQPIPHPWQAEPPLPISVTIDIQVSHHLPKSLPAPVGWEVIQLNGRIWMIKQNSRVTKIDAAQYLMPLAMYEAQAMTTASPAQFFDSISASCSKKLIWSIMCPVAGTL
jgi:hypothetical protein